MAGSITMAWDAVEASSSLVMEALVELRSHSDHRCLAAWGNQLFPCSLGAELVDPFPCPLLRHHASRDGTTHPGQFRAKPQMNTDTAAGPLRGLFLLTKLQELIQGYAVFSYRPSWACLRSVEAHPAFNCNLSHSFPLSKSLLFSDLQSRTGEVHMSQGPCNLSDWRDVTIKATAYRARLKLSTFAMFCALPTSNTF